MPDPAGSLASLGPADCLFYVIEADHLVAGTGPKDPRAQAIVP